MDLNKLLTENKTIKLGVVVLALCLVQYLDFWQVPEEVWYAVIGGMGITLRLGVNKAANNKE